MYHITELKCKGSYNYRIHLENLKKLKQLKANNNDITNLKFLNGCNDLEKVDLSTNKICKFPLIYGTTSLTSLTLK